MTCSAGGVGQSGGANSMSSSSSPVAQASCSHDAKQAFAAQLHQHRGHGHHGHHAKPADLPPVEITKPDAKPDVVLNDRRPLALIDPDVTLNESA